MPQLVMFGVRDPDVAMADKKLLIINRARQFDQFRIGRAFRIQEGICARD
jgi:hypothetical protein